MYRVALLTTIILLAAAPCHTRAQEKPEEQFRVEPGRTAAEYYNIGNWYAERDQHYRAIAYYKASVAADSRFAQAWVNMGASYRATGRHDAAVAAYRAAIDAGFDENFIYLNLGNAYLSAARRREAVSAFRTFTSLEPYDPDGYANLGIALFQLQEYTQAAEVFEKFLILDEENAYFHFQTARCYVLLKRFDDAAAKVRTALQLDPNVRYALLQDDDFKAFRRSAQYRQLLTEGRIQEK